MVDSNLIGGCNAEMQKSASELPAVAEIRRRGAIEPEYFMGYFLTFNCYGSWLPGDERAWVKRDRGIRDPNAGLHKFCREIMTDEPYLLDLATAKIVLAAVQEVCRYRNWDLIAAHVRTNHVHLIVDGLQEPDRTIAQF
jgi:hypothetical protein